MEINWKREKSSHILATVESTAHMGDYIGGEKEGREEEWRKKKDYRQTRQGSRKESLGTILNHIFYIRKDDSRDYVVHDDDESDDYPPRLPAS
ncbi:hypothetical protein Vi05172_g5857 [Venturia inaequalis]|nr:hypothetical protein Vi05172_g5857 [Venturia inaequalis]